VSEAVKVGQPLISLRDVCKGWYAGGTRIEVLHHIDLDIPLGSSTAIMGPSGSGKSTLVHILALLTPVDSGVYSFRGIPVSRNDQWWDSAIRQNIGIVFQDGKLIHNLTALKNVCVPLAHRGVWPKLQTEMAEHALEQVGLSHRINSFPNQLSGGETIRCAIARALVINPILVLADEPTGTLDSKSGDMVTELLFGFVQEQRSLVVVSHHPPLAERADHVVRIKDGLLNAS
jgi:putative ABC transport system ATP-binding protein